MGVEINHTLIAFRLYPAAEGLDAVREGAGVHICGAGVLPQVLPVIDEGVGQGVPLQQGQGILRLLQSLLGGDRLGEEVGAYGKPCLRGSLEIGQGLFVCAQLPGLGSAVAQTDDGKLYPGILHLLPVNVSLPFGDIDAMGGIFRQAGDVAVFLHPEILRAVGVGGQGGGGDGGFCGGLGGLRLGGLPKGVLHQYHCQHHQGSQSHQQTQPQFYV